MLPIVLLRPTVRARKVRAKAQSPQASRRSLRTTYQSDWDVRSLSQSRWLCVHAKGLDAKLGLDTCNEKPMIPLSTRSSNLVENGHRHGRFDLHPRLLAGGESVMLHNALNVWRDQHAEDQKEAPPPWEVLVTFFSNFYQRSQYIHLRQSNSDIHKKRLRLPKGLALANFSNTIRRSECSVQMERSRQLIWESPERRQRRARQGRPSRNRSSLARHWRKKVATRSAVFLSFGFVCPSICSKFARSTPSSLSAAGRTHPPSTRNPFATPIRDVLNE